MNTNLTVELVLAKEFVKYLNAIKKGGNLQENIDYWSKQSFYVER